MINEEDIDRLLKVSRTPTIVMASGDRYECDSVFQVSDALQVTGKLYDTKGDETFNVTAVLSYAHIAELIVQDNEQRLVIQG
ncbi:hypothetical protein [Azospirillum argentinense]